VARNAFNEILDVTKATTRTVDRLDARASATITGVSVVINIVVVAVVAVGNCSL
jgi:hypothetical protein